MQLMGVDALPIAPGQLPSPQQQHRATVPTTAPATAPVIAPTTAPAAGPSSGSPQQIEAKPVARPVAQPVIKPTANLADETTHENPALIGPPIHPLVATDPARAKAQSLLNELQARYEREAPHKHFVTDHHCIVFGEGDPKARLVFVGEAPGAEEDKVGRPFVGRAGQLLDKMIQAIGLARQDVYICNVLKTRPPNNATPTSDEAALCAPYLYEQLMIVDPVAIVTLGLPASRTILNSVESMGRLRGQWWEYQPPAALVARGAKPIPVMPTYHPAFLLRSYTKDNRQKVWSDLQAAAARIGHATPASARVQP